MSDIPGLRIVLDTPTHKVWALPDGIHYVDIYKYGTFVYCCVRNGSYRTFQQAQFTYSKVPHWEQMVELFKEMAVKRYPRNIMKRGAEVEKFMRRW